MQGTECDVSESLPPPAKISKLEEKSAASPQPPSDGKVENCAGSDVNCIARERAPPAGNKDEVVASPCSSAPPPLPPLDQFSLDRVLFEDPKAKSIAVAGQFAGSADTAVIIAEKSPLSGASLSELFCPRSKTSTNFQNNIYSQIEASCGGSVGDLRLMAVYPATEAHVTKYSQQTIHIIHETPEDYATITKPFIESQSFDIQWVYNVLDGKAEQDRMIYQDPHPETGFVLLPDFKWDQKDVQNLYLLAIVRRRDLLSLRELNEEHLPLLKNVLERGQEAIEQKYGIPSDQLRVYLHYQPSYYHLHVHFTQLSYAAPKTSIGDAHLLHDIIDNIERIDAHYYQKCRLSFTVKESSPLCREYQTQRNATTLR